MIAPGSRVKDDGSMSALILKLLMKLESCNIFSLDIISFDRNNQRKDQVYRGANYLRLIDWKRRGTDRIVNEGDALTAK